LARRRAIARSILAVPAFSSRCDVIGCVELSESDSRSTQLFTLIASVITKKLIRMPQSAESRQVFADTLKDGVVCPCRLLNIQRAFLQKRSNSPIMQRIARKKITIIKRDFSFRALDSQESGSTNSLLVLSVLTVSTTVLSVMCFFVRVFLPDRSSERATSKRK
jgi:hypothetical protein